MSPALDNPYPPESAAVHEHRSRLWAYDAGRVSLAFRDAHEQRKPLWMDRNRSADLLGIGLLGAVILRSGFAVDYGSACGVTAT
jgi:hypothetical protein